MNEVKIEHEGWFWVWANGRWLLDIHANEGPPSCKEGIPEPPPYNVSESGVVSHKTVKDVMVNSLVGKKLYVTGNADGIQVALTPGGFWTYETQDENVQHYYLKQSNDFDIQMRY